MKKTLFLLASAALLLVGCAKEKLSIESGADEMVTATFTAQMQYAPQTKAVTDGGGTKANRCVMEIYYGGVLYLRDVQSVDSGMKATFTPTLVSNRTYDVLFWADCGGENLADKYYKTNAVDLGLQAVEMMATSYAANDDARDAFFAKERVEVLQQVSTKEFELTRPFSQVNIITTDAAIIKNDNLYPDGVKMVYTAPTKFNLLSGELSEAKELTVTGAPYEAFDATSPALTLEMDYLFTGEDKSALDIAFEASKTGESAVTSHSFTNIPVQRNYRTNIKGALLTTTGNWVAEIDPIWEEPDIVKVVEVADIKSANEIINQYKETTNHLEVKFTAEPNDSGEPTGEQTSPSRAIVTTPIKEESVLSIEVLAQTKSLYVGDYPNEYTVTSVDTENAKHAVVNINVPESSSIVTLVINAPSKSVYINGKEVANVGTITSLDAITSQNTLIIEKDQIVGTLTIRQGGLEIHGTVNTLVIDENAHEANPVKVRTSENLSQEVFDVIYKAGEHDYIDRPKYIEKQNQDGTWNIFGQDVVAKVGNDEYYSVAAAVEAAEDGQTIVIVGPNHGAEAVTVAKTLTFLGDKEITLSDVKFTTSGAETEVTFKDLVFAGDSYISLQGGKKMTMNGCYADVTPTKITGISRSAFIVIGTSEGTSGLDLDITKSTIIASKGANASGDTYATSIFGWRYLNKVNISDNVFFSEEKPTQWIALKLMNAIDGAEVILKNNTVYANSNQYCFNGFDFYQNNSRNNFYSVYSENNTLIDAGSGSRTAFVVEGNAAKTNVRLFDKGSKMNGENVSLSMIDVENYGAASEGFLAMELEYNAQGEIIGGKFNRDLSVTERNQHLAPGYVLTDSGEGYWVVGGPYEARIDQVYYTTLQAAVDAVQTGETITLLCDIKTGFYGIEQILQKDFTVDPQGHLYYASGYSIDWDHSGYYITDQNTKLLYFNGGTALYGTTAFKGETLVVPEGVTDIAGNKRFAESTTLKYVKLSSTVTKLWNRFFNKAYALEKIYYKVGDEYVEGLAPYLTTIEDAVFMTCGLTSPIVIPSSMTEVPANLFQESHICSVVLPEGITAIGANAFRQIAELTEVTIPSTLQTIGNQAFRDCTNLKTINLLFEAVPETIGSFTFNAVSTMFGATTPGVIYVKNQDVADALKNAFDGNALQYYSIKNFDNHSIVYYKGTKIE